MALFDFLDPKKRDEAEKLKNLTKYHVGVVEAMWRDIAIIFNGGQIPKGSKFENLNTEQIKDKISEFIIERYKDVEEIGQAFANIKNFEW